MLNTQICIVGGGPAGMMLGYLLARSGISVVVLEKHKDFLRDFRGDTVHPSTLEIIDECGLSEKFSAIPQHRIQKASVRIGSETIPILDFHGLTPFDYLSLVPQWDFLDLIAKEAKALDNFQLVMEGEVTELIIESGIVKGAKAKTPGGMLEVKAQLVVGCDGRRSIVRKSLKLKILDLGAPMDAMWFRLPREPSDSEGMEAILGAGQMMVLLNRSEYWQIAYVVPKGSDATLRSQSIEAFQKRVGSLAPELKGRCLTIKSWDDVKTLVVSVDRLDRWHVPGALLIGDAAHTMSPIGGVGINLAIQDAVAAANVISNVISKGGELSEHAMSKVQALRERPTKRMQAFQVFAQNRVISATLDLTDQVPKIPSVIRWLTRFRRIRNIPARIVGYGFGREHVDTSHFLE